MSATRAKPWAPLIGLSSVPKKALFDHLVSGIEGFQAARRTGFLAKPGLSIDSITFGLDRVAAIVIAECFAGAVSTYEKRRLAIDTQEIGFDDIAPIVKNVPFAGDLAGLAAVDAEIICRQNMPLGIVFWVMAAILPSLARMG